MFVLCSLLAKVDRLFFVPGSEFILKYFSFCYIAIYQYIKLYYNNIFDYMQSYIAVIIEVKAKNIICGFTFF